MIDLAARLLDALDHGHQIDPISAHDPDFSLTAAYALQDVLTARRCARGAVIVGLKVGFTNRLIWQEYGIDAPIHGPVFDTTLAQDTVSLTGFAEPLIEPEVVLRLGASPRPGMTDTELLSCIEGIAPAFEIVRSPYPGWRGKAVDTVAAGGMHGALVLGHEVAFTPKMGPMLETLGAQVFRDGQRMEQGDARNLLGTGPLGVLRHLVGLPSAPVLQPGWIISTGTLTRALGIRPGKTWTVRFSDCPLGELQVVLR